MQFSLLDRVALDDRRLDRGRTAESGEDPAGVQWARFSRVELGEGAWLEVVRGWVSAPARLFEQLRDAADWELHERQMYERVVTVPRLVASCPGAAVSRPWMGESAVRVFPHRAPGEVVLQSAERLRELQAILSSRYARSLRSISLAFYRDGSDSVAFHGDRLGALRQDTVVVILSLGSPRHFLLRRAAASGRPLPRALLESGVGVARGRGGRCSSYALSVGEGDLLVMGGTCQETWEHCVPKQSGAGPRVAVMFRERSDEGDGAVRNLRGPRISA